MTNIYRDTLLAQLRSLKAIRIDEIDINTVGELSKIKINQSLPTEERVRSLLEQVRNPYFYKHGDVLVKMSFADNGRTLQSCLEDYLVSEVQVHR